ncbi:MAG TPA: tRNA pseudouridine(38-40) synthase TruA [Acidimicrobiia bacterium]|nr:tRNA pseudouridine(38-40) synthase TruA [Acidimicrobiia bacterium]
MPTLRLDLAYDGAGFKGYAAQSDASIRTIQGELEAALTTLLGSPHETAVAGRTDSGVHARGQVVSLRIDEEVDVGRLQRSLNGILGPEISVMAVSSVDDDFHARFSALWRKYRYTLSVGPAPDPLGRGHQWHVGPGLDTSAMEETAAHFAGEQDFGAFCRSIEGRTNVRRVEEAAWENDGPLLHFWIRANAFCHQMVRSLVGLSYDVGRGFTPVGSVAEIMASRDRGRVVTVAPPHGLVLWEVGY